MLKEKEVWDVVDRSYTNPITTPQIQKKEKDNTSASKIIKQRAKADLYINIIRKKNLQRS